MAEKIVDYISGLEVNATKEEIQAVQPMAQLLVEEYGYPKECIQTHPQYRVKASPSDRRKSYPVDIAVFDSVDRDESSVRIIVECKQKDRKDGVDQLEDYLRFSRAKLGVWFNGEERLYRHKTERDGQIYFSEIPNIPRYGERLRDIGLYQRKDLVAPSSLTLLFRVIRNYLAGNAVGATRDEVFAQQLINLIFCKIYDERFTQPDHMVQFRAGVDEAEREICNRIKSLFNRVKTTYDDVFNATDSIDLDDHTLTYIVGELQNYCLVEANRDVVGEAFETFIGHTLKGSQGQFFTPRNVVKLMVQIADLSPENVLIDPACGSGGFLIESLRYMWNRIDEQAEVYKWPASEIQDAKKEVAIKNIEGNDKDSFLSKVTKVYMALIGDGRGNIYCEDSLSERKNWNLATRMTFEKYDVILTNPPFGQNIKVTGASKLEQYKLAHKWEKNSASGRYRQTDKVKAEAPPQLLFIERCLQMLKPGGKLGIVLPESYFHGPSYRWIVQHIEEHHNIYAVIDLPHNTFRPHCNAKTLAVFVEKDAKPSDNVIFACAEEMGHNHLGKPKFRFDESTGRLSNVIWDDLERISEELKNVQHIDNMYVFTIRRDKIQNSVYVPRYYWNRKIRVAKQSAQTDSKVLIPMSDLIDNGIVEVFKGHGAPRNEYKGRGPVPYVRAGDIVNWEIYKNPVSGIPRDVYEELMRNKTKLEVEDIVFVKEGSYRIGDVALLSPNDTDIYLNHHSYVIRVLQEENQYGVDAYYLMHLLSHRLTKIQLPNLIFIDTTLPNIGDRYKELLLPLEASIDERKRISDLLRVTFKQKWDAQFNMSKIRLEFGSQPYSIEGEDVLE